MGTWVLRLTLHLINVNIHAKLKQDCSTHVKVMGQASIHMTFDPCDLDLRDGKWGLRMTLHLIGVNIHVKYKQDC